MGKKTITLFTLVMINLAAMGGVKGWPAIAGYGSGALFYLLLAVFLFFLPVAAVSAELATGWPENGGVFVWVREAFGFRSGFLAVWLLWFENVIWYPTILAFIAATSAYIFDPVWGENRFYVVSVALLAFWLMTLINLYGIEFYGWVSSIAALVGGILPSLVIIFLGFFWFYSGESIQWSGSHFIPKLSWDQLPIFAGVMLSFCGIEISAVHARDVRFPQRDYPRATLISTLLFVLLSLMGVFSIAAVVPREQLSLTSGTMQALIAFVSFFHLEQLVPLVAILIVIGALASLITWIVGPSRALCEAIGASRAFPSCFSRVNSKGMPHMLLLFQGVIVTLLTALFLFMPTISSGYWILVVMATQVYLLMYILMFAAAIRLRYRRADQVRSYRVPGNKLGIWIVGGVGILSSLATFLTGFIPPPLQISRGNSLFYCSFLLLGTLLIVLFPFLFFMKGRENVRS